MYLLACLRACLLRRCSFVPLVLMLSCRFILGTMLWHYFTCTNCHRAKKSCDRTGEDSSCSRCVLHSKKCCVRKPRGWVGKKVVTKVGGNDVSSRSVTKPKSKTGKKSAVKPKPEPQDDLGEQKTVESVANDILDFMPARDVKSLSPPPDASLPEIEHMSAGERAYASYCDALDLDIMTMLPTSVRATSVGMDLLDFVFGQGL
jgi:hypothetical protein